MSYPSQERAPSIAPARCGLEVIARDRALLIVHGGNIADGCSASKRPSCSRAVQSLPIHSWPRELQPPLVAAGEKSEATAVPDESRGRVVILRHRGPGNNRLQTPRASASGAAGVGCGPATPARCPSSRPSRSGSVGRSPCGHRILRPKGWRVGADSNTPPYMEPITETRLRRATERAVAGGHAIGALLFGSRARHRRSVERLGRLPRHQRGPRQRRGNRRA